MARRLLYLENMKALIASPPGRTLVFAFALAFTGSGVAKLIGPSGLAFGAMSVFAAVAIAVFALATAVNEHFAAGALAVIVLPFLLLLAHHAQGLVSSYAAGYALVIAGLAALGYALRPGPSTAHETPELAST